MGNREQRTETIWVERDIFPSFQILLTVVGELSHSCIQDVLLYPLPLLSKSHEGALGWVQNELKTGTWRIITSNSLSKCLLGFWKCLLWMRCGSIVLSGIQMETVCVWDIQWWKAARGWEESIRIQNEFAGWKNVHIFLSQSKCTSSRFMRNAVQVRDGDSQRENA